MGDKIAEQSPLLNATEQRFCSGRSAYFCMNVESMGDKIA
jgi:hypothetical protein